MIGYVEDDDEGTDNERETEGVGTARGRQQSLPHGDIHHVVGIRIRPSSVMMPVSIRRSEAEVGELVELLTFVNI